MFEQIETKVILATIIIVFSAIAFYMVVPKYYFITYGDMSTPIFRCNTITGKVDLIEIAEWGKFDTKKSNQKFAPR